MLRTFKYFDKKNTINDKIQNTDETKLNTLKEETSLLLMERAEEGETDILDLLEGIETIGIGVEEADLA